MNLLPRCLPFMLVLVACTVPQRRDDVYEPNDSIAQATLIDPGQALELRANEGNPDVFAVDVPTCERFDLVLVSRGLEDCATLRLEGPEGEVLYQDAVVDCVRSAPLHRGPGVTFETSRERTQAGRTTYVLSVLQPPPGRYHLTVRERGRPGAARYSWDYSLRVRIEG